MTRIDQALVALNSLHSVSITFTEYARDIAAQGPFFNFRAYAAEYDIPPICRPCEKTWGKGIGGWGDEECEECGGTGDANYDADEYYEDRDND